MNTTQPRFLNRLTRTALLLPTPADDAPQSAPLQLFSALAALALADLAEAEAVLARPLTSKLPMETLDDEQRGERYADVEHDLRIHLGEVQVSVRYFADAIARTHGVKVHPATLQALRTIEPRRTPKVLDRSEWTPWRSRHVNQRQKRAWKIQVATLKIEAACDCLDLYLDEIDTGLSPAAETALFSLRCVAPLLESMILRSRFVGGDYAAFVAAELVAWLPSRAPAMTKTQEANRR
jgi:hypothetical protein